MSTSPTDPVRRDRNLYNFQTDIRVRLSETDAVGIVFFGSFASYLDVGRMDYLNHIGAMRAVHGNHVDADSDVALNAKSVRDLPPGAVVSTSTNFHAPARYNDVLVVMVRMARVGHSSYTFHFLIEQKRDRSLVATGILTLVWLDETFAPMEIPKAFRDVIMSFEGEHLAST